MKRLHVFYDDRCAFCRWCRDWVASQPQAVAIDFHPRTSRAVREALPELSEFAPEENLAVFSDTGLVYVGDQALIMILWALRDWRGWSLWLGQDAHRPLARRLWNLLHRHRGKLGWMWRKPSGAAHAALATSGATETLPRGEEACHATLHR